MGLTYAGSSVIYDGRNVTVPDPPPSLVFSDEFTALSMVTSDTDATNTWRTRSIVDGGSVADSYQDYSARSWNPSPIQWPANSPYSVSGSVLTITVRRNPGLAGSGSAAWLGGLLVSNHLKNLHFGNGYFEWRASWPEPIRGMFPALWLYDPQGVKVKAEIDVVEIFGSPTGQPWASTLHRWIDGTTDTSRTVAYTNSDTAGWHRYGCELTDTALRFYKDGVLISEATTAEAAYYQGAQMALMIGYVMDPLFLPDGDPNLSTPSDPAPGVTSRMLVDYVRVYDRKPANLATGSDDPGI